jgi:hypothetical protein
VNVTVTVSEDRSALVAQMVLDAALEGLLPAAQAVAEEARLSITSRPKSGRVYKRPSGTHQASAPGEPPANDTGKLAASIVARSTGREGAEVVADGELAHTMEFGTTGGKVAPRPFMVPAAQNSRDAVRDAVADAIRKAFG